MTQPTESTPQDEQGSHASVGQDPAQAGGGRTEGETTVDDALGGQDDGA